jgi:predicted ATPase/DNA-binding CsgD family transcriptional regulator
VSQTAFIPLKEFMRASMTRMIPVFLDVAIGLAKLTHTVHTQKSIIRFLNPSGILVHPQTYVSLLAEQNQPDYAYLSPEQTGRINDSIDERSDLYALGIVFYEMLAGHRPLQANNPAEWAHAHLAVVPAELKQIRPDLAGPMNDIVMKLISKSPEDRYQTANGLLDDLSKCASSLRQRGKIEDFQIARTDESSRFRLPNSLFGRETEQQALYQAFDRVRAGSSVFVSVTGPAGVGKTALIQSIQSYVTRQQGRMITGKCDFTNRNAPLSSILLALTDLLNQIWSESSDRIDQYRSDLNRVLGRGAGVIAAFLPESQSLLGHVSTSEPLPAAETHERLRRLLPAFIRVFADRQTPLVMVIDDLQWADPATKELIGLIVNDPSLSGMMVIGTCRTESVFQEGSNNEYSAALSWIEQMLLLSAGGLNKATDRILLKNLQYVEVLRFLASVINENTDRIRPLAALLFQKTGGNPLYLHRLLDALHQESKIYFDSASGSWLWDETAIEEVPDQPDLLQWIQSRLRKMPNVTIRLLGIAAAMGRRFCPVILSGVDGRSLAETMDLLRRVEEEGLLRKEAGLHDEPGNNGSYLFIHDYVQQAAYGMVAESDKSALHLSIGHVLRQKLHENEEILFQLVYHLNLGRDHIKEDYERKELAEYNLQAGLKSKSSTAFEAALFYLQTGLDLLAAMDSENSLVRKIMLELMECQYMCGHVECAEELSDRLLGMTSELLERTQVYLIKIRMNAYLKKDEDAVRIGLQALTEFGWRLPLKPSKAVMRRERVRTKWSLYMKSGILPKLPAPSDPVYNALSELIMAVAVPAFITNGELSAVLYARFIRHGLVNGINEAFCFVLGAYGLITTLLYKSNEEGVRLIETAYQLSSTFESTSLKSRLHYLRGLLALNHNCDEAVTHFEEAAHFGLESLDLVFLCVSILTRVTTHIHDLSVLSERLAYYENTSKHLLDEVTLKIFGIAKWYLTVLNGDSKEIEHLHVPVQSSGFNAKMDNAAFYYCTCNIEIAYLAGRFRDALEWAQKGQLNAVRQTPIQRNKQSVYQFLSLAALYWEESPEERKRIKMVLYKQRDAMMRWSGFYGAKSTADQILTAEIHRINGNKPAAAKEYDKAMKTARSEGHALWEAIAYERASAYYRAENMMTIADALVADAYSAYKSWGAHVKALQLRQAFPHLSALMPANKKDAAEDRGISTNAEKQVPEAELYRHIEESILLQAAGWEADRDTRHLSERFLELAVLYAGGNKGYILDIRNELTVTVEAAYGTQEAEGEAHFAEPIVRYVLRTGETLVLADGSQGYYAEDPYIQLHRSKSILCMPIRYPNSPLSTVLYLENQLVAGVFTNERLAVMEMLFSRMVYLESLEQSRIPATGEGEPMVQDPLPPLPAKKQLIDPLTNREHDILQVLSAGLSNKEIAQRFGLTEGTVKSHVFRLYGKLGVQRRAQAIARARELQLIK